MSESLTANFSPPTEAGYFLRMLESGRISYGQACQDIELTERQRDWLIEKGVAEEWQIVELFRLRQETLRRFQRLARQKHADRTDALSGAASLPAESHPT